MPPHAGRRERIAVVDTLFCEAKADEAGKAWTVLEPARPAGSAA